MMRNIKTKPKLDMNPMVDMAFLLVAFFMMTTTFRPELPEEVLIPPSSAEVKLPERHLATITITKTGVVFFGIDNKFDRRELLGRVGREFGVFFDESQLNTYSLIATAGVPVEKMGEFLDAKASRRPFAQQGIPLTEDSQLFYWIRNARAVNPNLRFAINADGETKYPVIHEVFETLRELGVTRFNLVTEKTEEDVTKS
ncbi:biopolymer transporter ExbD [Cryomorphaceae bacterium 1068]|nr:biopolymer transporter ExbD [Cryomorphaceae bacterium 1068]